MGFVQPWNLPEGCSESPSRDGPPLAMGSDLIKLLRVHAGPEGGHHKLEKLEQEQC